MKKNKSVGRPKLFKDPRVTNIRFEKKELAQFKKIAKGNNISYQRLIRQIMSEIIKDPESYGLEAV